MSNEKHQHHHEHDHDVEEIDCLEAIDNLYAYLDGELNDEETMAKFRKHLGHCKSCYSRSELEGVINERLKTTSKDDAPDALKERIGEFLDDL
jgi:anti-sigma factor (TIGR02949 family)